MALLKHRRRVDAAARAVKKPSHVGPLPARPRTKGVTISMTAPTAPASTAQHAPTDQEISGSATPPIALRVPVIALHHGVSLTDDYGWLRAENWQEVMRKPALLDAGIRAHLEAENAYTETMLAGTKALQETLFHEMKARLKEDDRQVPQPHGPS